jgi:hypothetical protein
VISGPMVTLRSVARPGRTALDSSLVTHLLALVADGVTGADRAHRLPPSAVDQEGEMVDIAATSTS